MSKANKVSQEAVITKAHELGFFQIGFAKAAALPRRKEYYEQWIARGYNADMKWLENYDVRTDPKKYFSDVRTVIVVALSYYQTAGPRDFTVARYALGKDYHTVMKQKLDCLAKFIHGNNRSEYRAVCDTSPVAEKAWAVKSGIGWQGKNSLILTEEAGSFFVLGCLLTTEKFVQSKPVENKCGSCTKCLDGCPQKALVKPYTLNANRCSTYWTVESKDDEIPKSIARNMGRWIFGCDICQLVCPWNKNAMVNEKEFGNKFKSKTLNELSAISSDEFASSFSGNALARRKFNGLQRNIAPVLRGRSKK